MYDTLEGERGGKPARQILDELELGHRGASWACTRRVECYGDDNDGSSAGDAASCQPINLSRPSETGNKLLPVSLQTTAPNKMGSVRTSGWHPTE